MVLPPLLRTEIWKNRRRRTTHSALTFLTGKGIKKYTPLTSSSLRMEKELYVILTGSLGQQCDTVG
jgi:hypothetical protein